MSNKLKIPTKQEAEKLMEKANQQNPGKWYRHCHYVAQAAEAIAECHPKLNSEAAYVMALSHDIGKGLGKRKINHLFAGYDYMMELGYDDCARICISHSFAYQKIDSYFGGRNCRPEKLDFLKDYLAGAQFDLYDRLVQLCDAIADDNGFCLMEKRLINKAMKHGYRKYAIKKWTALFEIKQGMEKETGKNIYSLLPGVAENTFGFEI